MFLQMGLDSPNQFDPVQQIPLWAQPDLATGQGLENVNRPTLCFGTIDEAALLFVR